MNKLVARSATYVKRHAPEILTGISVIGTIGTAVLTGTGTVKAMDVVMSEMQDRAVLFETEGIEDPFTKKDYVKVAWPCYIPAALVGTSTIACILGANVLNAKRQAGLASAYMLLDATYKEYRAKANELYGDGTDVKIRDSITGDHLKKRLETNPEKVKVPENKILCCEETSNWFFDTTMAEIIDAKYQLNKKFTENGEAALNEYFEFLGIPTTDYGEELGWEWSAIMDMNCSSWIDIDTRLAKLDDGTEYYVLEPKVKPYAFNNPTNISGQLPFK